PLVLFVSLLTTSYGAWAFDLVVLLIPVLRMAVPLCRAGSWQRALAAYLAVNGLALLLNLAGVDGFWFLWLTPTALVSYLLLDRRAGRLFHLSVSLPAVSRP